MDDETTRPEAGNEHTIDSDVDPVAIATGGNDESRSFLSPPADDDLATTTDEVGHDGQHRARNDEQILYAERVGASTVALIERATPTRRVNTFGEDPAILSANLALYVIEIIAGARALEQIGRWVTDPVYIHLMRRMVIAARHRVVTGLDSKRPRVRLGRPVISEVSESVIESVVMVHQPGRSRAVAIRLEWYRTRWRATAIHVL